MNQAKVMCSVLMVGILGGIALDETYRSMSEPVYAFNEEVPAPEPKEVRIKIDYTGWDKARIQQEIRSHLPEIFITIAECESKTRQYNVNGDVLQGLVDHDDTGVLQINKRYHAEKAERMGIDLDTPVGNIEFAAYLYSQHGTQPWSASKHCWSK